MLDSVLDTGRVVHPRRLHAGHGDTDPRSVGGNMKLRTLIAAVLAVSLAGCAKISLTTQCPATSIGAGFALSGSTVGNQAIAMLGSAVGAAKLAAMAKAYKDAGVAMPAPITDTMTYTYAPIFGADSGNLTCIQPQQQTVVVTSAPAAVVQ